MTNKELIEALERIAQANFDAGRTSDAAAIREAVGVIKDCLTEATEEKDVCGRLV